MKQTTLFKVGLPAAVLAVACAAAPAAVADSVGFGDSADVDLIDIEFEQHWTVRDLQPSTDVIGYQPAGTLWEATATATVDHPGVPVISGFSARSDADSYPVLWGVPTAMGIAPNALPAGGSATGKIYFDVTGSAPTSVAYSAHGSDVAVWGAE